MIHPYLRLSRSNLSMGSNSKDVKKVLVDDVVLANHVGRIRFNKL
ncbi:unnamed protein product [Debaryomyces tyrocola]|nr:unnamed protein product [Debaryomyces tyrocola]